MWKCHAIYESWPCSVIATLGGQLYRILETVAPATVSQGSKISSHTRKLFLFTIASEGEQKITETSRPSAQGVSAHQTQEENRAIVSSSIRVPLRCKATHSRCSSRNKSSIQQLQPSRDVKERNPIHFSKCRTRRSTQQIVLDMIRDSTQWRTLHPKEGGLLQMDIGDHPPIPLAQNNCPLWQFPSYFSTVFRVPNFRICFEALNDVFLRP